MVDSLVAGYADALFAVASVEADSARVEDELFRLAQVLRADDGLQSSLEDQSIPASRRQQIVEDLLGGRASAATTAVVSMVVAAGRASRLPAIIDTFVERRVVSRNKTVARVRSAIELTDEQVERLTAALNGSTGKDIELKVVVDSSVLGGVVTEIDNDIIDGSVRRRLGQLRESFR